MNKRKQILLIISVLIMGILITGGSFAYWTWYSEPDKNIVFNTSKELKEYINYDEGESTFVGDFAVSDSYLDGMHSTIAISKKEEASTTTLIATINMDINDIGTNIANSSALKWAVTSGDSSNPGEVLSSGNFLGINSGETMMLLPSVEVTTEVEKYTIWIWLDASESPSSGLTGEILDTVVWTEINQTEGLETVFEITKLTNNYQNVSATIVNNQSNIVAYAVTRDNVEPLSNDLDAVIASPLVYKNSSNVTLLGLNEWIEIPAEEQGKIYNFSYAVPNTGTYYLWFRDADNKVVSNSVTVSEINTDKPICTWEIPRTIMVNKTITATLICINNNIVQSDLTIDDIELSSNIITLSDSIEKETIDGGYKYTFTITSGNNDGSVTLTLKENIIIDKYGNSNETTVSEELVVADVYNITYKDIGNTEFSGTHEEGYLVEYMPGETSVLDIPTKEGYTFAGYYTSSDGSGEYISKIDETQVGDITLYAKWIDSPPYGTANLSLNNGVFTLTLLDYGDNGSGLTGTYGYALINGGSCEDTTYEETTETSKIYNDDYVLGSTYYGCIKLTDNSGTIAYLKSPGIEMSTSSLYYNCANDSVDTEVYALNYTGNCEVIDDGDKFRVKLFTSGALTLYRDIQADVFLVGGGGGGSAYEHYYDVGGGGGGGYTLTKNDVSVVQNTNYDIVIGSGGSGGKNNDDDDMDPTDGTDSSAFGYVASGGFSANALTGGKGGSGGGNSESDGASNGEDSGGKGQISTPGPNGETGNTREFGEESGDLYAGGGGGGQTYHSTAGTYSEIGAGGSGGGGKGAAYGGNASNGGVNTGGGGGGGQVDGGDGGSGIVIIRFDKFSSNATSYTLVYNNNGGSGCYSKSILTGNTYGELCTPIREGYKFAGWYTAETDGTLITSDTEVTVTENQTLYAHWSESTNPIITFGKNGTTEYVLGDISSLITVTKGSNSLDISTFKYIYSTDINATPTEKFISGLNYTLENATGIYYLIAEACDIEGNCTKEVSEPFYVDNIAPDGNVTLTLDGSSINVLTNIVEENSGVKSYGYLIQEENVCPTTGYIVSENSSYTFTLLEPGVYYVCLKVEDNAGNVTYITSESIKALFTSNFDYTGDYQTYTVRMTGYYQLETWGAAGGYAHSSTYSGGYGGYSRGLTYLEKGTVLYVYVGGSGANATVAGSVNMGGYNGGGTGDGNDSENYKVAGGGGATHIATVNGLLSTLSASKDSILIVAGGGGGAGYYSSSDNGKGGHGGGIAGNAGNTSYDGGTGGTGGTQTAGAGFGYGASPSEGTGGGGGYYGGKAGADTGAGGGSGYISGLLEGETYAYDGTVSDTATSYSAKKGNGYAKITYISETYENVTMLNVGESVTFEKPTNYVVDISVSGNYQLEVWGAAGGYAHSTTYRGGYGGYATGVAYLEAGTKLYVYVGGKGENVYLNNESANGGYNGGGTGRGTSLMKSAGGGGATHIATVSGELSTLSASKDSILIVAGGGGGGGYYSSSDNGKGGEGGGYKGNAGTSSYDDSAGTGGTQSSGGGFGKGASFTSSAAGTGGGGGYYGGKRGYDTGAGGGSGYIANTNLVSTDTITKHMTCYSCTTSTAATTYTTSVTKVSETATADYAKKGNGYAKITLVS